MDKEQIQQHVEKVGMELSNANNLTGYARIAAITSIEFQAQEWLQQSLSIIEHQQREIARLTEGWHAIANLPMGEHPSDTRQFGKRMLKGETPYLLQEVSTDVQE